MFIFMALNCHTLSHQNNGAMPGMGSVHFIYLFRGFYHIGIRKDCNNVAYK